MSNSKYMIDSNLKSQDFSKNKLSKNLNEYREVEKKKLIFSLLLTLTVMILELSGGILISSIALVSDAWHMFTHAFAILIGLIAIFIARKPPCHHKTYGLYRTEVLAAFINGLFLLVVVGIIVFDSIERILFPENINGINMLVLALIGLGANIGSISILHGSQKNDINIKGVFYHMFGDAAASIGIVVVAFLIIFNPDWKILDPIISIAISIVIFVWAIGILKDSTRILLEMAPKGFNVHMISNALKAQFEEVEEVFNPHLWTITPGMLVFSAHIKIANKNSNIEFQETLIEKLNDFLHEKFKIVESTLQITIKNEPQACFFDY